MGNDKTWFLENGFFNDVGKKAVYSLEYELQKLLLTAHHDNMSENQLRVLQGNLAKLIGDKINEAIIAKSK